MSRIVGISDALGQISFELNKVGQIVRATSSSGEEISLAYDARGELQRAVAGAVAMDWAHDALGHIVRERIAVGDSATVVESERDARGRRIAMRTSLGHNQRTPRGG